MYAAIVKALVNTNGIDISGKNVEMPAGSYHLVSKHDLKYYRAHPDAFLIERDVDDDVPAFLVKDDFGNVTSLVGAGETFTIFNERICALGSATQAIATATETVIDFTSVILDTHSLADLADNTVANPFHGGTAAGYYKILGKVNFAASAAGTYRRVVVQQEVFAGIFVELVRADVEPRAAGETVVNIVSPLGGLQTSGQISLRITVQHDAGANLNVTSAFEFQFMN